MQEGTLAQEYQKLLWSKFNIANITIKVIIKRIYSIIFGFLVRRFETIGHERGEYPRFQSVLQLETSILDSYCSEPIVLS